MATSESIGHEDGFDQWVEARHAQLLAGGETDEAIDETTPVASEIMRNADLCLRVLDQMRRAQGGSSVGSSPDTHPDRIAPAPADPPLQIGRFRIERELGRGGAGVVLLATDPKLGRQVALKLPHPDVLASDELKRRFKREAEVGARLAHPHIVAVYEVGNEGPLVYMATEFCAGGTLADWLAERKGPLTAREAAVLFLPLAQALQHAHSRGVLHRDLKPGNVLLAEQCPDDAPPSDVASRLKLADFGLAKVLEDDGGLTRTGAILGTANYMAPEQADSQRGDIGVQTDIFSLGAMLYEALVGKPPFLGANKTDTLRRVLTDEPVAPRKLRPDVPADLDAICLKCLDKRPERRYSSALALAEDLDRFLVGKPTVARPIGTRERLIKWLRRHPATAALMATGLAATLVLFGVVAAYNIRLRSVLADAVDARNAESEARRGVEARARTMFNRQYVDDMGELFTAWGNRKITGMRKRLEQYNPKPGEEDLRTFPWYLLWRRCYADQEVLYQRDQPVYSIAYSPDGRLLASGGKDRAVCVWNVITGRMEREWTVHTDEVNCVDFSPDGTLLASASNDGRILIWPLTNESPPRELKEAPRKWIYAVRFSPDGKFLAAGGEDEIVWIWETERFTICNEWDEPGTVESIAFSPDGQQLAVGCSREQQRTGRTGELRVRDLRSNALIFPSDGRFDSPVNSVAYFHKDSALAFTAKNCPAIRIISPKSGEVVREIPRDTTIAAHDLAISPDDRWLIIAQREGLVRLVDLSNAHPDEMLLGHEGPIWSAAFSPNGKAAVTAGGDGTVRRWDLDGVQSRTVSVSLDHRPDFPEGVLSPDGRWLAVFSSLDEVEIRDTDHYTLQRRIPATTRIGIGGQLRFSPDNRKLLVASCNASPEPKADEQFDLRLIDIVDGTERHLGGVANEVRDIAFSSDGRYVAIGDAKSHVAVREQSSNRVLASFEAGSGTVASLVFAQNDRSLVSACDGQLRLWNTTNWQQQSDRLIPPGIEARFLALSADGRFLAVTGDRQLSVWDFSTREYVVLAGHAQDIEAVAFSHDSLTLATASLDHTIRLWDVRTWRAMGSLDQNAIKWWSLAFTQNGGIAAFGVGGQRDACIPIMRTWTAMPSRMPPAGP